MSTPTNLPETPMGGAEQDSSPKSKEKFQQQLQHIFQTTGENESEMLTHSQQQSQAPKTHKKESTVRLTTRITMLWAPQKSLCYRLKVSIEVKCKKHTQQSTSSRET